MPSEYVDITTPEGVANAYLTRPDGDGPHPGVLFLIDAFGLRPRIEEMADRIAAHGYTVLAPNLFYRGGRNPIPSDQGDLHDPASREKLFAAIMPLMGALTPAAVDSDGKAYLDFLATVADGPVGITGYCMGTRVGLRIASSYPDRVAALGGFHGGHLVTDGPDSPHTWVDSIKAEIFFGHADNDQGNTPENIATLDAALDAAGVKHTTEVFTGAAHGYTMSDAAVYDEDAAERHFRELFALLDRTLGAGVTA